MKVILGNYIFYLVGLAINLPKFVRVTQTKVRNDLIYIAHRFKFYMCRLRI